MDTVETAFGNRVRRLREQKKVSLRDVAQQADVSRSALSQVERGQGSPSLTAAARTRGRARVQLSDLLDGDAPVAELRLPHRSPDQTILDAISSDLDVLEGYPRREGSDPAELSTASAVLFEDAGFAPVGDAGPRLVVSRDLA
jgi:transcriptional regulator with XRE-family HTH domain